MTNRCAGIVQRRAGFTLVELAVTLFIVALLLGSVLVPLQTQVESRKIEETQRILEQAREALLGYASSFGYFPCPATAASNGQEPAGTNHATGRCSTALIPTPGEYNGFLPAALLGFTPVDEQGFALDSWGGSAANRIRYAVSDVKIVGVDPTFTTSGGMAAAGIPAIAANGNLLHICGSGAGVVPATNCGAAQTLASNAAAVVWSVGSNATTGGTSVHEAENQNPSIVTAPDRIFVSRVRVTSGANEFDDQLTWISGFAVVSRLVATGQLP